MLWLGKIAWTCVQAMKEKTEGTEEGFTEELIFENYLVYPK